MLQAGTFWGYLTTGEAIVFLRVPFEDASTLEYHLAEPGEDVRTQQSQLGEAEFLHRLAVSQVLVFCLGALRLSNMSQDWLRNANARLEEWEKDYRSMLAEMPETVRKSPP